MKYILPKVVLVNSIVERVMKHRQALLNQPGSYIPPRFRMLLKAAKDQQKAHPAAIVHLLERLAYYGVKGSAAVLAKSAGIVQHYIQNVNRKLEFAVPIFFAKDHFMQLPRIKLPAKHVYTVLRQLIGRYKGPQPPQERVAVIYGRRDDYRPLYIVTFDNEILQIPADLADVCSYLLMADIARRDVVVIATPAGLSLVTKETSVTFGYDKTVYVNDCKVPMNFSPLNLEGVSVTAESDKVSATTNRGLNLTCYKEESDVCIISWSDSRRNGTVGLLGTNNYDKHSDRRTPDGTVADNWDDLLPHYVVSGPGQCHKSLTSSTGGTICNPELHSMCFDLFQTSGPGQAPGGTCEYFLELDSFRAACIQESYDCDSDEEDICHTYQAFTHVCEAGKLQTAATTKLPDVCKQLSEEVIPDTGALDIVFVISQHSTMAAGQEPWEYLFDLLNSGAALPYRVRIGVVGFAGADNSHSPYVFKQDGSYFANLEDIDWTSLESLQADGTVKADGFDAMKLAALFPFSSTANRMIILLMTKDQGKEVYDDLDSLRETLMDQNIILNVFSTYRKLSSKTVIGVDWQERVISRQNNLQETKSLPQNDYIELVKATKGAVFDILTISRGRQKKIERILEHFTLQVTQRNDDSVCPAA